MKKLLIIGLVTLLCTSVMSKDKIKLVNGKKLKGTIVNIEQGRLEFEKKGEITIYSSNEIQWIEIDSDNEFIINTIIKSVPLNQQDWCQDGQTDAYTYHKRGGGNFALGFLFGAFGFVGVALSSPKPPYHPSLISNTDKMNNNTYLMCYEKQAKKKNLGSAGLGWASGFLLIILLI